MALKKQCSYRSCTKILGDGIKFCDYHQKIYDKEQKKRYKEYNRKRLNDEDAKKRMDFYNSKTWIRLSEDIKNHYFGLCLVCWLRNRIVNSFYTHHIEEVAERPDLILDEDNLIPLCTKCHSRVHREYDKSKKDRENMKRVLIEILIKFNEEFYYRKYKR